MNKVMNINALLLDQRLQSRTEINEETVTEYAEAIKDGDEFPPVLVYFTGTHYYLTDGYHRYHAHNRAEKVSILCEVVNGTFRDAQLRATSVNKNHGIRRTYADKRKAVMTLLDDLDWSDWSNAKIAKHCGVSHTFVSDLRNSSGKMPDTIKYTTPTGKVMTKAKAPGRQAKEKEPELKGPEIKPEAPPEHDHEQEAIDALIAENESLKARLAVAAMEGTDEEKQAASELIDQLREELRIANIELVSVKQSRDRFQAENAQLKTQCASYQRQLKKLQG